MSSKYALKITHTTPEEITLTQHIDNEGVTYGCVTYTFDLIVSEFLIETSYFGYGAAKIAVPHVDTDEMIKFFTRVKEEQNNLSIMDALKGTG